MASTQRYVGMRTPFGVIVEVEARVYDPLCVVKAKDGSMSRYRLPFLVAMGLKAVCLNSRLAIKKQLNDPEFYSKDIK